MGRVRLVGSRGQRLRCAVAATRRERTRGLIGRRRIAGDEALLLPEATSVHTFGMTFPVLVAWLDEHLEVVEVRRVPRRRLLAPRRRARHVLECNVDTDVRTGDAFRVVAAQTRGEARS